MSDWAGAWILIPKTGNICSGYTYVDVKDTFLMDLIIDKVNYVLENDSICDIIKNEYFQAWDRNKNSFLDI